MKQGIFKLLAATIFLAGANVSWAAESWEWISPKPQGNTLTAVAYGNGRFLAVGSYGAVISSTNGTNWIVENRLGANTLSRITFGDGKFLIGGQNGMWSTTDGVVWNRVTLPRNYTPLQVHDLTFGGDKFWAVANFDLFSSTNGADWKFETNYVSDSLLNIAYDNDRLVAIDGRRALVYNTLAVSNRLSITNLPVETRLTGHLATSIEAGNGYFAAGTQDGSVLVSVNGTNWISVKALPDSSSVSALAFGDGKFVATTRYQFVSSTDLLTWTAPDTVPGDTLALAFGSDRWIGVGANGTLAFSMDGADWTNLTTYSHNFFTSIAYTTNGFVAAGEQGLVKVFPAASPQLPGWSEGVAINAVGELAGQTVGVGANNATGAGMIMNLSAPSLMRTVPNVFFQDFVTTGNDLVAVGFGPFSATMAKRINNVWSTQEFPDSGGFRTIAHGAAGFIVGTDIGNVLYSTNATQWTMKNVTSEPIRGAAYGNGRYVMVTQFGQFMVSTNGTNWSATFRSNDVLLRVRYFPAEGVFLAAGSAMYYSTDGLIWRKASLASPFTFYDVALAGGTIVTTSYENTALVAGALIYPEVQKSGSSFSFEALESRWRPNAGMVQSSDDMIHWRDEKPLAPGKAPDLYRFEDVQATAQQRFYRVISPQLNWE